MTTNTCEPVCGLRFSEFAAKSATQAEVRANALPRTSCVADIAFACFIIAVLAQRQAAGQGQDGEHVNVEWLPLVGKWLEDGRREGFTILD